MKKVTIRISRSADGALKCMGERFVKAWKTRKSAGDTLQLKSPAAVRCIFRITTGELALASIV